MVTKEHATWNQLARYYELKTNRPLYMSREGEKYSLTYDDSQLPSHYGWKTESRIDVLEQQYQRLKSGNLTIPTIPLTKRTTNVAQLVKQLDSDGRWVSTFAGERLIGQPKFAAGDRYLSSEIFSKNLSELAEFLEATK